VLSFTVRERKIYVKIGLTEARSAKAQISSAVAALRERLPEGWRIDVAMAPQTGQGRPGAIITVRSTEGTTADVVVEYKSRLDPANLGTALAQLERWPQAQPMVVAPFLSVGTRRLLGERGARWADSTRRSSLGGSLSGAQPPEAMSERSSLTMSLVRLRLGSFRTYDAPGGSMAGSSLPTLS